MFVSSTKNKNLAFYTSLIYSEIYSPDIGRPPLKNIKNIFYFFRFFARSILFFKEGINNALMVWSRAFMELKSSFLSIFYRFPLSIRLHTILISKQNSVIEILSLLLICLLKMCSAILLAFFFQLWTCWTDISGFPTSIKNMYSLSVLGLYCSMYLKFLS